ncbi:MAG: polysaccharide biosynthesis/export family protein [Thermoanaerobaculum sp.]
MIRICLARGRSRGFRVSWVLSLALAFPWAGASAAWAQAPATFSGAGSYRIGPRDLVDVKVFEVPELNVSLRVADDGTINLPLVGPVVAQGLTETELAERLRAILEAKYVQRASVVVQVREFRARPISVIGAVRQPGNLAFSGRWRLLDAITAAGGLAENHGGQIFILRRAENGLTDQVSISVDDLMVKADPDVNIPIFADDLINIPAAAEVTVYCLGEVRQPGAVVFKSTEPITVLTALARAGGLTDRASKRIVVRRSAREGGGSSEIELDYKKLLAGKEKDVPLKPGDILVVKEAFF